MQAGAAAIEAILERHEPVYGINTGFGRLASVRIDDSDLALLQRNLVLSHMAGVGDAAAGKRRPARHGAQGGEPRAGCVGRPLDDGAAARRLPASRLDAGDPGPRIGRRLRGPGAAGPPERRPHRRGRDRHARRAHERTRRSGARRARAARARAERGPRASQRHAGLDRARARGPLRSRAGVSLRPRDRGACDRCRQGIRCTLRPAHPGGAPPPRTDRGCGRAARAHGGQPHPRVPPHGRRPHPGPVLPALPAAGHGRLPDPAAPGRRHPRDRGERRHGQPPRLLRDPAKCCPAAISTRNPSRSRPT